jgi:hypothetical protein
LRAASAALDLVLEPGCAAGIHKTELQAHRRSIEDFGLVGSKADQQREVVHVLGDAGTL